MVEGFRVPKEFRSGPPPIPVDALPTDEARKTQNIERIEKIRADIKGLKEQAANLKGDITDLSFDETKGAEVADKKRALMILEKEIADMQAQISN